MLPGTSFQEVLPLHQEEKVLEDGEINRVVICSGKLYWHLMHQRRSQKRHDVTLVRVEQLSPFPYEALAAELRRSPPSSLPPSLAYSFIWYSLSFSSIILFYFYVLSSCRYPRALTSNEIVWAQEEPKNMGPWSFVQPRLSYLFDQMAADDASKEAQPGNVRVSYIGRPPSASPATAQFELHSQEVP
jgi:2-oxoglutarate dehydrogenase E1 component